MIDIVVRKAARVRDKAHSGNRSKMLPATSGREVVAVLIKTGFRVRRIRGSHYVLSHPNRRICTVPVHAGKSLQKGTLCNILHQAGLSVEEFLRLL